VSMDAARRLASLLGRRGLAVPARLLADAHRPLAPLMSDLAVALAPMVPPVGGRTGADLATLLDDPAGLDRLIDELDSMPRRGPRAEPG
jgi:hypothetical protein